MLPKPSQKLGATLRHWDVGLVICGKSIVVFLQ
jgi:hypothetical protein